MCQGGRHIQASSPFVRESIGAFEIQDERELATFARLVPNAKSSFGLCIGVAQNRIKGAAQRANRILSPSLELNRDDANDGFLLCVCAVSASYPCREHTRRRVAL